MHGTVRIQMKKVSDVCAYGLFFFFSAINKGFSCITYFSPEISLKCLFVLISYQVTRPLLHSSFLFRIFVFLFYISHLDSHFANFSGASCQYLFPSPHCNFCLVTLLLLFRPCCPSYLLLQTVYQFFSNNV